LRNDAAMFWDLPLSASPAPRCVSDETLTCCRPLMCVCVCVYVSVFKRYRQHSTFINKESSILSKCSYTANIETHVRTHTACYSRTMFVMLKFRITQEISQYLCTTRPRKSTHTWLWCKHPSKHSRLATPKVDLPECMRERLLHIHDPWSAKFSFLRFLVLFSAFSYENAEKRCAASTEGKCDDFSYVYVSCDE
jgi:hypothetical protein